MSTRHLVEICVRGIQAQLEANLPAALNDIRTNRNDNFVTMEPPRDYFVYPKAMGYRTPAVFIIGDRIDFQKRATAANHINANCRVNITVLVEDKDSERIMIKSYRYQAAIHEVLDQTQFSSSDNKSKVTLVIQGASFSPLYTNAGNTGDPQTVFRREIALEVDCYIFEQL
jgi:hypothetical protein